MNTPIKFNLAKLLNEKKADLKTYYSFQAHSSMWYFIHSKSDQEKLKLYTYSFFNSFDNMLYAPTIAEVVMWLYETHKIWISVYHHKDWAADANDEYVFRTNYTRIKDYKSPTEAYEAAIEHILNKLI
jgi:hypothetical protein